MLRPPFALGDTVKWLVLTVEQDDLLKATGCLVNICDYTVRPAKQEEVTFK